MRNGLGTGFARDLDLSLGDQRPRDRRAEQVDPLIERIHAKHREHVVANELLAKILYIDLADAHLFGLGASGFQLFSLTEIGGEGHDLAIILFLQPSQDDRGVQPARIGEHNFIYVF
jgi:hypothetical protein